MTPFLTSEEKRKTGGTSLLNQNIQDETLEELQETWKRSKISSFGKYVESDIIQKKRLENIAWRLMAMKLFQAPSQLEASISQKKAPKAITQPAKFSKSLPSTPKAGLSWEQSPRLARVRSYTESTVQPISQKATRPPTPHPMSTSLSDLRLAEAQESAKMPPVAVPSLRQFLPEIDSLQPTPRAFDRMVGTIGKGGLCVEYRYAL